MTSRKRAVVMLGAGWSAAAGRPLTSKLFEEEPFAESVGAAALHDRVSREWQKWRRDYPDEFTERFIGDMRGGAAWPAVVRFVAARLAEPDHVRLEHELR